MNKKELGEKIYQASHIRGHFKLRSGQISDEYFDKYLFETDPQLLTEIASRLKKLVPKDTQVLAGLEMGGIPLATAISIQTGIPVVFVRKKAKEYGTCKLAEGIEVRDKTACIVEDVVTTGGQIIMSANDLKQLGAITKTVLCVIERDKTCRQKLDEKGLELLSLFSMEELQPNANSAN